MIERQPWQVEICRQVGGPFDSPSFGSISYHWQQYKEARKRLKIASIEAKRQAVETEIARLEAKPEAVSVPVNKHDEALVLIVKSFERDARWPTARELNEKHGVSIGTASRALKSIAG